MKQKWKAVAVSKRIRPIHYSLRTPVPLVIDKEYYVSFRTGEAFHCRLVDVYQLEEGRRYILIEVPVKPCRTHAYADCADRYQLYPDEIGRTPQEAVRHQITL